MKVGFKLALALTLALAFSLAGCSTIKNSFNSKDQKHHASQSKKHAQAKKAKAKHSVARKETPDAPKADQAGNPSTREDADAAKTPEKNAKVLPGKLHVTVLYKNTALYKNRPIAGAMISVTGKTGISASNPYLSKTSDSGKCNIVLPEGDYDISASYLKQQKQQTVHIQPGQTEEITITLP